jgi:hypothetical protein
MTFSVAIAPTQIGIGGPVFGLKLNQLLLAFCALLSIVASGARAESIVDVRYGDPVERYGHFALGRPHEYSRLTVRSDSGREASFSLPESEVFEDLSPRIVTLAAGEAKQILTIVSRRDSGARLVLFRLSAGRLDIAAQSPAIGTPMRWLNPVGVADLDGDGQAEIAAVITPHIGGTLKIYRRDGKDLVEIAALGGFSNHVYGSVELALSAPAVIAGKTHLLAPDATRRLLRVVRLEKGRLVDVSHCPLTAPITGPIKVLSSTEVSVQLLSGPQVVVLNKCLKS